MQTFWMERLVCPACRGKLNWEIKRGDQSRIESGQAVCSACAAVYPIQEGIGIFLTPDLPRNDLWKQAGGFMDQHFRENPGLEEKMMDTPLASLSAADRFLRSMVLEDEGRFEEAREAHNASFPELYTADTLACWEQQYRTIIDFLNGKAEPIVDLASGRGYLVERLLRELPNPIVATDFSPSTSCTKTASVSSIWDWRNTSACWRLMRAAHPSVMELFHS